MSEESTPPASAEESASDDADPEEEGLFDIDPIWFKVGFFVFLLLWLAYILWETTSYDRFEDEFFPYVVGIPLLLMLVLQLTIIRYPSIVDRAMPSRSETAADEDDELQQRLEQATDQAARPKQEQERYEILMIGWIIILPFMMFYIGMGWTLVLYVFAFTWYFVRDIQTAATVTVVVFVFVYVLFIRFLDMILWTGQFELVDPLGYLDDIVDMFL